ncbi:MAG: cytochrome c, partial [Gammaproteobacteria bacterium]|nr:cytochrome c [Gammaproteobacteria bacterium]
MRPLLLSVAVPGFAVAAAAGPCLAAGQQIEATGAPTYTHEQAVAGEAVYREACADCHLANLRGDFEAPELAGGSFRSYWGDVPIGELLENIRSTMPEDAPESLSDAEYAAIVAYIIRENGGVLGGVSLSEAPAAGAGLSQPAGAAPGSQAATGQRPDLTADRGD